ncbi:MAG: hypothetical protein M1833_001878 [Piccolia ochrophora]|nr:MAG: hypothetical protein M1833_001878 [Piccolia ochrophora]
MSVWNPDNIKDVAESVGIVALSNDVVQNLSRDVEYRLSQVLDEAVKFMRHGKRTTMTTQDVSLALRILDVEPLYGYESTRPLRFGEASIGPGQPLFYVEDEEVDFEKLINAPLPKVPREISFTAHWLAVEGVQPSIPQNPTSADSRNQELVPRGPGANASLAALTGSDNVTVKPLVKHVLSKELQLYFEKICTAILTEDESSESRIAAFSSVRHDPGLHQLVPYFVQYIAEKVTHNLKSIHTLSQMMHLTSAMLDNESLFCDPYIASLVPPILTCLVGRRLGDASHVVAHYTLRSLAASLVSVISKKYATTSQTLRPRLARTCLKHFLDPNKSLGVHFGAILGLQAVGGAEAVRVLILPNVKTYEAVLASAGEDARQDAEMVVEAILKGLVLLEEEGVLTNGSGGYGDDDVREKLVDVVGSVVGNKIFGLGRPGLNRVVLAGTNGQQR